MKKPILLILSELAAHSHINPEADCSLLQSNSGMPATQAIRLTFFPTGHSKRKHHANFQLR